MIIAPYTFQCRELLFVLGRMLPPPDRSESGTIIEAAGQLANTLARNVIVVDETELLVELDDPVEAIALARELELRVDRCIAAPLALELLRESGQPARDTWSWLCTQLKLSPNPDGGVVKLKGITRDRLPAGVDQIPSGSGVLVWVIALVDQVVFVTRDQTLGRASDLADIAIDDAHVSPGRGAAIVRRHGTWVIEDRSTEGIVVDGSRCNSRCLIPGMTIHVGGARLVILSMR